MTRAPPAGPDRHPERALSLVRRTDPIPGWLTIPFWNNFFLMIVLVWIQAGFAMVILSAALRAIPEETIEAAILDGASPFQVFFKIKVPQIMGTIVVVWTTITITVLKVFDIVLAMTNGQWRRRFWPTTCSTSCSAPMTGGWDRQRHDHHAAGDADPDLERLQRPQGNAVGERGAWTTSPERKSSLVWAVHISVLVLVAALGAADLRPAGLVLPHGRPDLVFGLVARADDAGTAAAAHPPVGDRDRGGRRLRDRGNLFSKPGHHRQCLGHKLARAHRLRAGRCGGSG